MSETINATGKTILADCCGGIILPEEKYIHDETFNFHVFCFDKSRCKELKVYDVKNDLVQHALNLCYAIEELPASEQQTKASIMASNLKRDVITHFVEEKHKPENKIGEQIPNSITFAIQFVSNWFKENGIKKWKLMDVCSENYNEPKTLDELQTRIIERGKCLGVDWNELSWVLGQIDDIQKKESK